MTNKPMLVINHIAPVGLIAQDGSELSKAFCDNYLLQAVNEIIDQDEVSAMHFLGSTAGHALVHMFQMNININQLDSVLAQIRSHVIQTQGS